MLTCRYSDRYRKVMEDTQPTSKTGGGYWLSMRKVQEKVPFIAKTTYQQEILNGEETAAQQLDKTIGLTCTIANYDAARQT